jgi:ubiquinone/menaquinone biosynthesis C-methylase UbiE
MGSETEIDKVDTPEEKSHQHKGRFTEGLLDSKLVLKALNIRTGQTILDAGCGNGYMAKLFSKEVSQSGKVYALDLNPYFIEILKNEVEGTNIETIEGDITKPTQLKASSIDIIYLSTVFHIFSQRQRQGFLQEVKRLLKLKAFLTIVEIEKKGESRGTPVHLCILLCLCGLESSHDNQSMSNSIALIFPHDLCGSKHSAPIYR